MNGYYCGFFNCIHVGISSCFETCSEEYSMTVHSSSANYNIYFSFVNQGRKLCATMSFLSHAVSWNDESWHDKWLVFVRTVKIIRPVSCSCTNSPNDSIILIFIHAFNLISKFSFWVYIYLFTYKKSEGSWKVSYKSFSYYNMNRVWDSSKLNQSFEEVDENKTNDVPKLLTIILL